MATGLIDKNKEQRDRGLGEVGEAVGRTARGVVQTAKGVYQAAGLVKVAAVGTLAFGIVDFKDASDAVLADPGSIP
ncbi:hypothetical protein [Ammoniphilus sp. YIM 78166]|uniref:hypothetical protein n=1 Tax=Ammoniphilus sp. YIM 78166 TaxID=1644106 RepID=UPI00106FCAE9|nr:hypothetical protein [Ammoniphilus sp. YIM 78166]